MKKIVILLLVIVFQSCQYFKKNVPNKEVLLHQELNKIDWTEVDEFPSISQCDSLVNKLERKECLFSFMTKEIQKKLNQDSIKTKFPKLDTIALQLTVLPNSKVIFKTKLTKYSRDYDIIEVDSVIQSKLVNFLEVEPAIKRGVKVKSQFTLPIVL